MSTYTALLEQTAAHQYRITFPDFTGLSCTTVSHDLVRPLAEAALASQLEELRSQGMPLPEPQALQDATQGQVHCIALLITADADRDSKFHAHNAQPELQTAA